MLAATMSEFRGIPVVTTGAKYQTEQGFAAIKNGVKARADRQQVPREPKPKWLKARMPAGERFNALRSTVHEHRLATVCEESICPNIGECWNNGTATIMLMGKVCTRACQFCAVDTGNPHGWLDPEEVENSARTVELMNLAYVVLTSVDRDDLPDGGARHYADCIRAIKALCPNTAVEALTPDFAGHLVDVATVVDSGLDVFAQKIVAWNAATTKTTDLVMTPLRMAIWQRQREGHPVEPGGADGWNEPAQETHHQRVDQPLSQEVRGHSESEGHLTERLPVDRPRGDAVHRQNGHAANQAAHEREPHAFSGRGLVDPAERADDAECGGKRVHADRSVGQRRVERVSARPVQQGVHAALLPCE